MRLIFSFILTIFFVSLVAEADEVIEMSSKGDHSKYLQITMGEFAIHGVDNKIHGLMTDGIEACIVMAAYNKKEHVGLLAHFWIERDISGTFDIFKRKLAELKLNPKDFDAYIANGNEQTLPEVADLIRTETEKMGMHVLHFSIFGTASYSGNNWTLLMNLETGKIAGYHLGSPGLLINSKSRYERISPHHLMVLDQAPDSF